MASVSKSLRCRARASPVRHQEEHRFGNFRGVRETALAAGPRLAPQLLIMFRAVLPSPQRTKLLLLAVAIVVIGTRPSARSAGTDLKLV